MDTIKTVTTTGSNITIDCPACGEGQVSAMTSEREESYKVLGLIPIMKLRNTFVVCTKCKKQLTSTLRLDDLEAAKPSDLKKALSVRESFVGQAVAVLSILLCWAPIVGFGLGLLGVVLTWRSSSWPRTLSQVATVIGLLVTIAVLAFL